MEKVARTYKVSFVVCSSELGEDDPVMQNVSSVCSLSTFSDLCSYAVKSDGFYW